jgi:hypothetical protein
MVVWYEGSLFLAFCVKLEGGAAAAALPPLPVRGAEAVVIQACRRRRRRRPKGRVGLTVGRPGSAFLLVVRTKSRPSAGRSSSRCSCCWSNDSQASMARPIALLAMAAPVRRSQEELQSVSVVMDNPETYPSSYY